MSAHAQNSAIGPQVIPQNKCDVHSRRLGLPTSIQGCPNIDAPTNTLGPDGLRLGTQPIGHAPLQVVVLVAEGATRTKNAPSSPRNCRGKICTSIRAGGAWLLPTPDGFTKYEPTFFRGSICVRSPWAFPGAPLIGRAPSQPTPDSGLHILLTKEN